ncbi:unnamed protein product, partial [Mesorhabditis belari]|uniref:Uncharacterized protein n=1 Tax=Mesorhabditis belari TaxID=2138241 RepID=A0AAF3FR28_9BILA
MQINCGVNEAGTTFLLPDGWPAIQFFVDSNKAPSRPETLADIEAQFSDYKRDPESPYVIDETGERTLLPALLCSSRTKSSTSLVEIRNCQNHNIRHIMKVIVVDAHHDFVLLFSLNGSMIFEDYPHASKS